MRILKIIIGLAITAWWITMMRAVYINEVAGHLDPGGPVITTLEPVEFWSDYATARLQGDTIGSVAVLLRRQDDGRYRYEHRGHFETALLDKNIRAQLAGRAILSPELALESFFYTTRINGKPFDLIGSVTDGELQLRIDSPYLETEQVLPLDGPVRLDKSLTPFLVRRPDFEVGKSYTFTTFDPITQATREGRIEVLDSDDEFADYLLIARMDNATVNSWVTKEGQNVASSTSLGLETESITRESALLLDQKSEEPIALFMSAVLPTESLRGDPQQVALRFPGLRPEFRPPETPRQKWSGSGEVLVAHAAAEIPSETRISREGPLADTTGIHNIVRNFGAATFRREAPANERISDILAWMRNHLDETPSLGSPTAYETYTSHRGDSRGQARLFADLGRSAGLPVRCVSGLRHETGGFVAHFWNEVATPAGWLLVDPAKGRVGIPGDYIAFRKGPDIDEIFMQDLMRAGRLEIAAQEPES